MSEGCTHNCDTCGENCESRIEKINTHDGVIIKHVIGIVSGKGGVGKSLTTSLLASALAKKGHSVGILDADITGPSIPQAFHITEKATGNGNVIFPAVSKNNIRIISANMLLQNDDDAIIWRGSLISNLVKQFYTDVDWGELEYLLIDMPPGTGDVPLTIFQSIKMDGIIVVTSPQKLVSTIVSKAINMANEMNVNVIGVIENMSFVECKECKTKNYVFGKGITKETCDKFNIPLLAELPLNENIASSIDSGDVEDLEIRELDNAVEVLEKLGE